MRTLSVLAVVFLLTVLIGMTFTVPIASYNDSPQRAEDQFTNVAPKPKDSFATMLKLSGSSCSTAPRAPPRRRHPRCVR